MLGASQVTRMLVWFTTVSVTFLGEFGEPVEVVYSQFSTVSLTVHFRLVGEKPEITEPTNPIQRRPHDLALE